MQTDGASLPAHRASGARDQPPRRSRNATCARADDEGAAAPQQSVVATSSAMAHFEVVEIAPPLGVLEAMLAASAYGERNEAPAASGPGGAATGFTWEELTQRVQCSNKELNAALRRLHALELHGRWTILEPGAALRPRNRALLLPCHALTLLPLLLRRLPAQPA